MIDSHNFESQVFVNHSHDEIICYLPVITVFHRHFSQVLSNILSVASHVTGDSTCSWFWSCSVKFLSMTDYFRHRKYFSSNLT